MTRWRRALAMGRRKRYSSLMSTGQGSSGAAARVLASGSEALGRLRRGEITLDAYLDFRADEAVRDLVGVVSAERVRTIRDALREQLATDPVLTAMVEHVARTARDGGPAR